MKGCRIIRLLDTRNIVELSDNNSYLQIFGHGPGGEDHFSSGVASGNRTELWRRPLHWVDYLALPVKYDVDAPSFRFSSSHSSTSGDDVDEERLFDFTIRGEEVQLSGFSH